VETTGVRDAQAGAFTAASATIQGVRDCLREALVLVSVAYRQDLGGIELQWSREPDGAADAISSYDLRWDGRSVPIVRVARLKARESLLYLSDETQRWGRGLPYVLRVVAPIEAREDRAPLESPETEHRIYVQGQGALEVVPTPNPVRGGSVLFVEAADDTRVQIFDLQGQLVRTLEGALGGGLTWDLRNHAGNQVASGVYVYVARDARGTRTGRIAILR
jgi:hypothetical protein